MDSAGFDPTDWGHWLLIICFLGVSLVGLSLSWQWNKDVKAERKRAQLARRLARELHGGRALSGRHDSGGRDSSVTPLRFPAARTVRRPFSKVSSAYRSLRPSHSRSEDVRFKNSQPGSPRSSKAIPSEQSVGSHSRKKNRR